MGEIKKVKVETNIIKKNIRRKKLMNERTTPFFLMAPALAFISIVVIYPILRTVVISFYDYVLWRPLDTKFIGFGNYIRAIKDEVFRLSFLNTLKWLVLILFFQFLFGLIIALLLNQKFKLREAARAAILIPWVTPSILTALMWTWMYHGAYGVINKVLVTLGIIGSEVPWLAQTSTALYSIIATMIWQGVPFFAIMLVAGLASIPNELYEAAVVDGASKFKSFIYITLPGLKNTIFITTLLRTIWISNNIDMVYMMTGGGPANSTMTLSVYTFIVAQKSFDFGYASANSIFLSLFLSIIAIFYIKNLNLSGVK